MENSGSNGADVGGGNTQRAEFVGVIAAEVVAQIEARWGEGLAKLFIIPRIRTAADATRRDVALMLRKIDGDQGPEKTAEAFKAAMQ